MPEIPVKQMTLREMFLGAERHVRELIEHFDLDFMPKAESLARMLESRGGRPDASPKGRIEDSVLRNQAAKLLQSEAYTQEVYAKLHEYLQAIDRSTSRIVTGE